MSAIEERLAEGMKLFVSAYADTAKVIMREAGNAVRNLGRIVRAAANDEVNVAGLEARYYVRAGLDPAYAGAEGLAGLLASIRAGHEPGLMFVSVANRELVALSALRGYLAHRGVSK